MSEGHEVIIAVALTGDYPSLLADMEEPEQQLVADELMRHGIGDGKPSFFADIARFSSAIDDAFVNITGNICADSMDLVAEIGRQAEAAPEGELLTLNLNIDGVSFCMKVVRSAGGVRAVVLAVCEMLVGNRLSKMKLSDQYQREMGVLRARRRERQILLCGGGALSACPDLEPPFAQPYFEDRRRGRKGDRIARRQEYRAMQNLHSKRGKGRR